MVTNQSLTYCACLNARLVTWQPMRYNFTMHAWRHVTRDYCVCLNIHFPVGREVFEETCILCESRIFSKYASRKINTFWMSPLLLHVGCRVIWQNIASPRFFSFRYHHQHLQLRIDRLQLLAFIKVKNQVEKLFSPHNQT